MLLFVGLGNPGAKYARNRHNIGFMAVDEIARRHGFAPWRRRFQGETSEGTLDRERVILLKPTTYMNDSGRDEVLLRIDQAPIGTITAHAAVHTARQKSQWKNRIM